MTRYSQGDGEAKDTRGPGWLHDEAGRPYREEKGTRIYQRGEDRDAALDDTYRLSPQMLSLMDATSPVRQVASLVCVHAQALAELFWREAPTTAGSDPRTKFAQWCERHFGRQLEPSAQGVLWGEARARLLGVSPGRTLALFESYAEQLRYERAASEMPTWGGDVQGEDEALAENSLARVQEIVFRATGKRAGTVNVPRPLSKRQWERRANELKRQAQEITAREEVPS